ncbi:circularly permuted type 2 ATP-grasp protein [Salinarimonas chemoclinalis]|uniref:circularly permuted type 2 ATP-grasp protein n=1 Tax=Salinarimonas chemoclinalis TaxID=3241599 RepID=UPI0035580C73
MTALTRAQARELIHGLSHWTQGYAPLPGAADELIGPDGTPRPAWARLARALGPMSPGDLARGFGSAERHIREVGISYRVHGEAADRAWPVAHLPIVIDAAEWKAIAAGVAQRARLMEALLAEIHAGGAAPDGAPPAAAIVGSPNYLRPLVGVAPPGGRHLSLYAVDIGRGPDGRWWVLNDRTQAPSGAGYALENRIVLSRVYPALMERLRVQRLAPFFAAFRDGLAALGAREDPRIGLLTPGPYSETYFEQATLARYLGLPLVEGDDLVARDGSVYVRTVSGLKRIDVLWRRVDGDYCDPLALDARSRLGVPGLVAALRAGGVAMANMPGAGAVEQPALMGFMALQCRRLLGEDPLLPNIATWWCGEPVAREEALARLETLAFADAFVPGPSTLGAELDAQGRAALAARIRTRGVDVVGQEVVRLSTTPVWRDGTLEPRPFSLRVYAAATPSGWQVMPGGFARIAERPDARAVSMGEGTLSADVWVLADAPVARVSLVPQERIRRVSGHLPSRAADNLFWLGRYLERAEATTRLVAALAAARLEGGEGGPGDETVARLEGLIRALGAVPDDEEDAESADGEGGGGREAAAVSLVAALPARDIARTALDDAAAPGSVAAAIASARRAASHLRDRLAPQAWRLVSELSPGAPAGEDEIASPADTLDRAQALLERFAAIAGLVHENMTRSDGWRLLDMGRRIERGLAACRVTGALAGAGATSGDLDALLDIVDCQITYRTRYLFGPAPAPVRDLALIDPNSPRSLAFQAERILEHVRALPALREDGLPEPPERLAATLARGLAIADAATIDAPALAAFEADLADLADAIGARYFPHGAAAERPEKLSGLA